MWLNRIRKMDKITKEKISKKLCGRVLSELAKSNMKGRKPWNTGKSLSKENKIKISESKKNKKCINKNNKNIFVDINDIDIYLLNGWNIGRYR